MGVVRIGPQFPKRVRCVLFLGKHTLAAAGTDIHVCEFNTLMYSLKGHQHKVTHMVDIGDFLVSVDAGNVVIVWNYKTSLEYSRFELPRYVHLSSLIHPDTYINKVLFSTAEGLMYLWNFSTKKEVFKFDGWGSPILTMVQSPVLDVVAVALKDGRIVLHNIKVNRTLFTFQHEKEEITSLVFRTDGNNHLLSGTKSGTLTIWDLDKQKLVTSIPFAHEGSIVSLYFFYNEPLFVSTGTDNSIKLWIFDNANVCPRILKQQSGHSKPPVKLLFYGGNEEVLSASSDQSVRVFPTSTNETNYELSQGNLQAKANQNKQSVLSLKLSPVVDMAFSLSKEMYWGNVVTCHDSSHVGFAWMKLKRCMVDPAFKSLTNDFWTAVAVSTCGNFAYFGSLRGRIKLFNLQSGKRTDTEKKGGHSKAVSGLHVDLCNKYVVSTGLDGLIKIWGRKSLTLRETIDNGAPITKSRLSLDTNLLAVFCDSLVLKVYHLTTLSLVRVFNGHASFATGLAFTPDSRWLICSEGNGNVRVWDLPSSRCIDWFRVSSPIVAMDMSPVGDVLVTSHVGRRGLYLWANANHFGKVFLKPIPAKPREIGVPTEGTVDNEDEPTNDKDESDFALWENMDRKAQLDRALVTNSAVPKTKWQNLLNLELIKERNKPKLPPKKPQNAPFFLPTLPGLTPKFITAPEDEVIPSPAQSKIINFAALRPKTRFITLLEKADKTKNYGEFLQEVLSMSPTAIDFEIRSLNPDNDFFELKLVMQWLKWQLESNFHYDLVQAFLAVFLREQGNLIRSDNTLRAMAKEILELQKKTWKMMQDMLRNNLCLLNFFQNIQT
uniref:Uncharacterized protein n=1 Tax=Arcella intermedia TaxID=1963864 RepID=A0A6B2KXS5_9EUKA